SRAARSWALVPLPARHWQQAALSPRVPPQAVPRWGLQAVRLPVPAARSALPPAPIAPVPKASLA
ncbi:hypothetical protein, partial [Paenibacillus sp. VT-400]|uniref:hypothetical protein n=1 Tax=Paenibacillus sp. VT-400 TaxID=1495853 RepID=UPI001F44F06C